MVSLEVRGDTAILNKYGYEYHFPASCLGDITVKDFLAEGTIATVFTCTYKGNECILRMCLLEIINVNFENNENPYDWEPWHTDIYENELKYITILSQNNIGPKLYNSWICTIIDGHNSFGVKEYKIGIQIYERFDMDLEKYIEKYPNQFLLGFNSIVDEVLKLMLEIDKLGFGDDDVSLSNILVKLDSNGNVVQVKISDPIISEPDFNRQAMETLENIIYKKLALLHKEVETVDRVLVLQEEHNIIIRNNVSHVLEIEVNTMKELQGYLEIIDPTDDFIEKILTREDHPYLSYADMHQLLSEYLILKDNPLAAEFPLYLGTGTTNLMVISARGYLPLLEQNRPNVENIGIENKQNMNALNYAKNDRMKKYLDEIVSDNLLYLKDMVWLETDKYYNDAKITIELIIRHKIPIPDKIVIGYVVYPDLFEKLIVLIEYISPQDFSSILSRCIETGKTNPSWALESIKIILNNRHKIRYTEKLPESLGLQYPKIMMPKHVINVACYNLSKEYGYPDIYYEKIPKHVLDNYELYALYDLYTGYRDGYYQVSYGHYNGIIKYYEYRIQKYNFYNETDSLVFDCVLDGVLAYLEAVYGPQPEVGNIQDLWVLLHHYQNLHI